MNFRKVVAVLMFTAQAASASGSDISSGLNDLSQMFTLGYALCQTKFKIAVQKRQLYGSDSVEGRQGAIDVKTCVDSTSAQVELMVQNLRLQLGGKPKAEEALKEFYVEWRSIIGDYAGMQTGNVRGMALLKGRLEAVRVEASW